MLQPCLCDFLKCFMVLHSSSNNREHGEYSITVVPKILHGLWESCLQVAGGWGSNTISIIMSAKQGRVKQYVTYLGGCCGSLESLGSLSAPCCCCPQSLEMLSKGRKKRRKLTSCFGTQLKVCVFSFSQRFQALRKAAGAPYYPPPRESHRTPR